MKGTSLVLGLSLLASFTALALEAQETFWDVPEDAWYAESVEHLAELGILQGYPDDSFQPDSPLNRAEFAVVIDRLLEYLETGTVSVDSESTLARVELEVPFTAQAPYGDWAMPYQEACEEASLIMVAYYLSGEALTAEVAEEEILEMVAWEEDHGYGVDVSAAEIAEIAEAFYGLSADVYYDEEVTLDRIRQELDNGHPVIVPAAGQVLANPNYTGEGPPYHMVVIVGYDENGFLVHDPGSSSGAFYLYDEATLDAALHDWTGSKSTVETEGRRAMVVVTD